MKMVGRIAVATLVGLLATSAYAFQEESVGAKGSLKAAPEKNISQPLLPTVPNAELQGATSPAESGPAGAIVKIPGLGRLGVIPKLDFGLELLYGANKQPAVDPLVKDEADDGDLRIRGSVKHRF